MEIKIGQDIRKYKTKDVGNFSFKELSYIAVGCVAGFALYKIMGDVEYAIPPIGIACIFGFFKPYGLTFTQFLKTVIVENLSQQCYINETDFEYSMEDLQENYPDVIPVEWSVIQTSTATKIKRSKQEKQMTFK